MRTRIPAWLASTFLAVAFVSCYDPAVRDRVVLTLGPQGQTRVVIETVFKQGKELTRQEQEEIQQVLDRYDQGRDPWLRGLERAGASEITHACHGADRQPESILREANLPSVESLVRAMPDSIANLALRVDDVRRLSTLIVVHIDVPETIRDNRRRLEREIATWSVSRYKLSARQCDLYDYLAERTERRRAVLSAMIDPAAIQHTLEPRETALLKRLAEASETAGDPAASGTGPEQGGEKPAIASMSFSAFDHDLCVRLPADAVDVTASPGIVPLVVEGGEGGEGGEDKNTSDESLTWCFERLTLEELAARMSPEADPPWSTFDEGLPADLERIDNAPFTCLRYEGPRDIEEKAWETILPKAWYELTWSEATTTPAFP